MLSWDAGIDPVDFFYSFSTSSDQEGSSFLFPDA